MPHSTSHITDEDFQRQIQSPFTRVRDLAGMRQRLLNMTPDSDEEATAIADALAATTRAVLVAEARAFGTPPHPNISREVVDQANTMLTTGQRLRALMSTFIQEERQAGRQDGFKHAAARAAQLLVDILTDYETDQPVQSRQRANAVLAILGPFGNPTNGSGNNPQQ